MVKAMFESNAPKYKFGGSGSNLSLNSSREDVRKSSASKASCKPKEERKWVLDSINKYFDVIVEEEDEEEENYSDDDDNDDYDDDDEESDEESDDENNVSFGNINEKEQDEEKAQTFKSSSRMRGMLSSVVGNLSRSVSNLAGTQIVSSLKKNLGSQISLRASYTDLTQ